MRAVIFKGERYDSIKDLSNSIGIEAKKIWNHLARGSEVGNTGECVDYAFEPEDILELKEKNNNKILNTF